MALVEVGPWGENIDGTPWEFKPDDFDRINKMYVAAEDCINSITFGYVDKTGKVVPPVTYGGKGGTNYPITFGANEVITKISGTFGEVDNVKVITSLIIDTNLKIHYEYGKSVGTPFSLPVANGKFVGFFGTYGDYIESIGAVLAPASGN